jgi:hypothetical protein
LIELTGSDEAVNFSITTPFPHDDALVGLAASTNKAARGLDNTKTIQELLKGTGQIPALIRNDSKFLRGVDTQGLLSKTLSEVKELLNKKQFKTFMKHFEGRDLRHGK